MNLSASSLVWGMRFRSGSSRTCAIMNCSSGTLRRRSRFAALVRFRRPILFWSVTELIRRILNVPVIEGVDGLTGIDILFTEGFEVLMAKTNGKLLLFARIAWKC